MKQNKMEKLDACQERKKYTWAKRIGIGIATVLTATTGFFGVQSHKNAQKLDSALAREQQQMIVASSLAGQLAQAQQRAKEAEARVKKAEARARSAENLNEQTRKIFSKIKPAYTAECDYNADDPKIKKMKVSPEELMNRENAKETARYNNACKTLGKNLGVKSTVIKKLLDDLEK